MFVFVVPASLGTGIIVFLLLRGFIRWITMPGMRGKQPRKQPHDRRCTRWFRCFEA
jgi:hypothetical protein